MGRDSLFGVQMFSMGTVARAVLPLEQGGSFGLLHKRLYNALSAHGLSTFNIVNSVGLQVCRRRGGAEVLD